MFLNTYNHQRYFKVEQNYFEKVYRNEIKLKRDVRTTFIFANPTCWIDLSQVSKTCQKEISKQLHSFDFLNALNKHVEVTSTFH